MTREARSKTQSLHGLGAVGLSLLLSFCLPHHGWTLEPDDILYHRVGNVTLRPHVAVSQIYSDNIYFRSDERIPFIDPNGNLAFIEKEGDFITSVSGGNALQLGSRRGNFLETSYTYSHRFFTEHTEQNIGRHIGKIDGSISRGRVTLTPRFSLNRFASPLSGSLRFAGVNSGDLVERTIIDTSFRGQIRLTPKTYTRTTVSYNLSDIQSGISLYDQDDIRFNQDIGYQLRPKLALSFGGVYGQRDIQPNSPLQARGSGQRYVGGNLSAEGEFTERLDGEVRFGIQQASFESGANSFVSPVVGFALNYRMGRDFYSTVDYQKETFVGVQDSRASGVSDRIKLSFWKPMGARKNLIASLSGTAQIRNWEKGTGASSNRKDEQYFISAGLEYRLKDWLTSSFSYAWQDFSSSLSQTGTFGIIDYGVNTVSVTLRVGY